MIEFSALLTYAKKRAYNFLDIEYAPEKESKKIRLTRCSLWVDDKFRKELHMLPLNQTPVEYMAHLSDTVTIIIEYFVGQSKYIHRYGTNTNILFPPHATEPQPTKRKKHAVKVFAWEPGNVPDNITPNWFMWAGPEFDFHGKEIPLFLIAEQPKTEKTVFIIAMFDDGTITNTEATYVSEIDMNFDTRYTKSTKPATMAELQFIERVSRMSVEEYHMAFSQKHEPASSSESESEDSFTHKNGE